MGQDERSGKSRAQNVSGDGSGTPPEMNQGGFNRGGNRGGYGRQQGGYGGRLQGGYGGRQQGGYGGNQGGYR